MQRLDLDFPPADATDGPVCALRDARTPPGSDSDVTTASKKPYSANRDVLETSK